MRITTGASSKFPPQRELQLSLCTRLTTQPMRTMEEPFVQSLMLLCLSLQSKHQKHQAFEAELHANADRIRGVIDMGNSLIERGACAGSEDAVKVGTFQSCLALLSAVFW